ncbi:aminotransferase class I/II-fold pyridoxal phosphate-dependent enzyme [Paenibacillus arenilitoris]|uniref:Aminotransferase class I/II-fold pyridoxal phosphate-dependent enzyme n=1 Tax=Paenibacillus arenilitoris TaxID=2772299 RepID=A0A927CWL6_9BACL|nr:aminotransferase class I/II-fold pyridoxal phosphate-dependent enzyme [Paenibacillus arenilitoris]MBD2872860.1 aminotransferase class I/II-fold pyridoxal phosphate-dependent enzyme [Paenibacillus arenilitoris]
MKLFYAPLLEALISHAESEPAGFHVPGHRYGEALKQKLILNDAGHHPAEWFSAVMRLDVTELSTTDDLHHPEASILEAQRLAARTFGADESFFLVGGSTAGNLALLLALCEQPGDLVIVQRNVHKSIINGLKLAGASAVFLSPQIDPCTGLATIPSLQDVEEALRRYPEAKGVVLSNPNYYGMGIHLQAYAELIHRFQKPLVVDEAHGAHYGFHPELPPSALSEGADAVVQSAHKTLPALTMGAMLHVRGDRIRRDKLRQSLAMIQSSSPSFPILASLDISRAMIDALGGQLFEQGLGAAAMFRAWLRHSEFPIREAERTAVKEEAAARYADPLRLVLYDSSERISGYELQLRLERYGCYAEMADPRYVVLVFGVQTSQEDIRKLQHGVEAISIAMKEQETNPPAGSAAVLDASGVTYQPQSMSEPVSFTRDRYAQADSKRMKLEHAVDCLSAEMVTPYPPGIVILYPGERITAAIAGQITRLASMGAKFQGASDPSMATIEVYKGQ